MKFKLSKKDTISRRKFLKCTGTIVFAFGSGCYVLSGCQSKTGDTKVGGSDGYLLVDVKKCQGCISCMLACSLIHEGLQNPSLSRIQILQNPFEKFPDDLTIEQCRQCVDPACVAACPEDALTVNAAFGNVRMVDKEKCTGCGSCVDACPYTPKRLIIIEDEKYNQDLKSQKCDLCANTPYHWDEKGGGPDGKQACVEVCPVGAITFTRQIPVQDGDKGYKVNLRDKNWRKLGYPNS